METDEEGDEIRAADNAIPAHTRFLGVWEGDLYEVVNASPEPVTITFPSPTPDGWVVTVKTGRAAERTRWWELRRRWKARVRRGD